MEDVPEATLEVAGISKRFDAITAVDDVSFDVHPGEILGFLGPNGAGKTTTLRMILSIFRPDRGAIRFERTDAPPPKARTGYLPEERGLYGDARVLDLLVYFGVLKGLHRKEAYARAQTWLEAFALRDWEKKKVDKLSKGMQQKVQFIASVLHRPALLVLDEPFSGLDPVNQDLLKQIIRQLKSDGASILLSSHQMNRVEELCDRIFLIHRGRRVLYGGLEEIKQAHGEHLVTLRFRGDGSCLRSVEGITDLSLDAGSATLRLERTTSPDSFIRRLPEELELLALHVDRPPLHDLFVHAVSGRQE